MSGNRYTQAAEQFFDDDSDTETPASPGSESSENDDATPEIMENETSDYYIGIGHTKAAATAFVKAHPKMQTNWSNRKESDLKPQEKWMKALHEAKKPLGARQKDENPFGISFGKDEGYAAEFGHELPTIETVEIDPGILGLLESQEGKALDDDGEPTYPEGSTDELGNGLPILIPAFDGEPLPIAVKSEEQLEGALEMLEKIPDEPEVAKIPEDETTPIEEAAEALGMKPEILEGDLEGYPVPSELSVGEIRDLITDLEDATLVHTMLRIEKAMDDRKTAKKALNGRLNRLKESNESKPEVNDDAAASFFDDAEDANEPDEAADKAPAAIDGTEDVGKATKVKMAMSLVEDDGMDIEEAKAMVGL